jgi:predicted RNA-binding Zn-ribbon protein involved in translation (DUF1610 family)
MAWFRGAAALASLDTASKSVVAYGENGAGKSSFVDAVEFLMSDGKIRHLAHEYSGRRQEKGVINTHIPRAEKAKLTVSLAGGAEVKAEIEQNGKYSCSGMEALKDWNYGRTVLRQDEVAAFIHGTKGDKYSALLPLFGLYPLELAAQNVRQLAKEIDRQFEITKARDLLNQVELNRKRIFGGDDDAQISAKVDALHAKYAPDKAVTVNSQTRCEEITVAVENRIARFNAEQKRYLTIQSAAAVDLKADIESVQAANAKLAGAVEPMIQEKLTVLQSASAFANKLGQQEEVKCPACGRLISSEAFQEHVREENKRLRDILEIFNSRTAAVGTLSDSVKSLKFAFGKADLKSWRDELAKGDHVENLKYLNAVNADSLRTSCSSEDLTGLQQKLLPLIEVAAAASKDAPPDVQQLLTDKNVTQTARDVIKAKSQKDVLQRAVTLISFLNALEQGIRDEIKLRCQSVINEISEDIKAMWEILHPNKAIRGIQLYVPKDADKAIDIGLTFHDIKQDSPRLTLSEGNRNSLGLCIFLAMAKREEDKDHPLLLDDVVVSLDRNHRGMIAELLQKQFSQRQVIIFTHDREWYTELRQQLDPAAWIFKVLMPYETPNLGVRWSAKTSTFDDARAQLKERPDAAGNDVRKIMDIELALFADRLQIRMPYLRGEQNDKRMAHDFLERFIADGKTCFEKKGAKDYEIHNEAIESFKRADQLILSWANRASHSFDLVRSEATKLIDACEQALGFFKCPSCGKGIAFADAEAKEWTQCQCGSVRWRYGKG